MKQQKTAGQMEPVTGEVSPPPRYASRKLWKMEPYYSAHVAAMTTEGLHSKGDIAAELAIRDIRIGQLLTAIRDAELGEGCEFNMREAIRENERLVRELTIVDPGRLRGDVVE